MTLRPRLFAAVPIPPDADSGVDVSRADITVSGLDHSGLSYELRVFLNNPAADAATPLTGAAGYAGSIHVYGQGRPPPTSPADAAARLRLPRTIIATDAIRAQPAELGELAVTLVPVGVGETEADVDLYDAEIAVRIEGGGGGDGV